VSAIVERSSAETPVALRSLDGVIASLESRRRRILQRATWTILILMASAPFGFGPFGFMLWLQEAVLTGAAAELQRTLVDWTTPYLDRIGIVVSVVPVVWLLGAIFAVRSFILRPKYEYRAAFKEQVLTAVCAEHFPGIRYEPGEGISWRVLDESGLFPFVSDVYRSDDRFTGRSGATDVRFAEAHAQRVYKKGWGKNRETVYETIFRGIVFCADFPKHFASTTRLLPKGAPGGARGPGEEPAELEDPRFEATFSTWTTDQVDVRYVLSPGLMERLTALNARFPGMRARFEAGRMVLFLPDFRDRFEPSVLRPADSRAQLAEFVADVRSCLDVVDALNLNTRIWSKQ
jgi:Protein of unknown function (DUF3137)